MENKKLTFITGGVRSGKSRLAEEKAIEKAAQSGGGLHYIACGQVTDAEMAERVRRHQRQRAEGEAAWMTWEQPVQLDKIASKFSKGDVILLDCLTTLVTNEWFLSSGDEQRWEHPAYHQEVKERVLQEIEALLATGASVIIVSNELVFEPLVSALVFYYAKVLGELHQQLVKAAEEAVLVEHGLPQIWKGGGLR
ncbi:bifunctional adenosylcobinamide kinase/adenosylcobinamide-phosphate guanylyltransferase [Bacillus xiapuensis]|uniref:bifunctional adenosylcobinamide kinase/adenosylcobinamide-phosphate guanylyltransferase n=1 Tax=Bacillus xiapuensis TaxID=2014075 RepID=UPI000C24A6BF|nr:bifunctional adenosylcobinamide kinase/adenosylcobinamide-phosphate guanylyltransferase [Bacillus xiapuensis]